MATPFFKLQSFTLNVFNANATALRINTFDAAGSPVDVSEDYTLEGIRIRSLSNPNPEFGWTGVGGFLGGGVGQELQGPTAVFDATGFTISLTAAQATAICKAAPSLVNQLSLSISNDDGTTDQLVAVGNLTVDSRSKV